MILNEGVIKFGISKWNKTGSLGKGSFSGIERIRKKLYSLKLIGFDENAKLGYGNISSRSKGNTFVITGTQTGNMARLDGSHYCTITNVDFNNNSVECEGPVLPSSESVTHAACYYSNEKIKAVVHIHHAGLWEKLIRNDCPATPADAEYGSVKLSGSIMDIAGSEKKISARTIVLKGHRDGIICFGKNLNIVAKTIIGLYNKYAK